MSSESVKVCDLELEKLADLAKCWDDLNSVFQKYIQGLGASAAGCSTTLASVAEKVDLNLYNEV